VGGNLQLIELRTHIYIIKNGSGYYTYNIEEGLSIRMNEESKKFIDCIVENNIEYYIDRRLKLEL